MCNKEHNFERKTLRNVSKICMLHLYQTQCIEEKYILYHLSGLHTGRCIGFFINFTQFLVRSVRKYMLSPQRMSQIAKTFVFFFSCGEKVNTNMTIYDYLWKLMLFYDRLPLGLLTYHHLNTFRLQVIRLGRCSYIYRLITAYLLLRVNLDKIMHARWDFDASSARTRRVSAMDKHQNWSASALFCLNSRSQSKYAAVNLIHTRRKQTFFSFIMW